jgi:hypothetical protein
MVLHPTWCSALRTRDKVKGRTNSNEGRWDALAKPVNEHVLLRRPESHPYDVGSQVVESLFKGEFFVVSELAERRSLASDDINSRELPPQFCLKFGDHRVSGTVQHMANFEFSAAIHGVEHQVRSRNWRLELNEPESSPNPDQWCSIGQVQVRGIQLSTHFRVIFRQ